MNQDLEPLKAYAPQMFSNIVAAISLLKMATKDNVIMTYGESAELVKEVSSTLACGLSSINVYPVGQNHELDMFEKCESL